MSGLILMTFKWKTTTTMEIRTRQIHLKTSKHNRLWFHQEHLEHLKQHWPSKLSKVKYRSSSDKKERTISRPSCSSGRLMTWLAPTGGPTRQPRPMWPTTSKDSPGLALRNGGDAGLDGRPTHMDKFETEVPAGICNPDRREIDHGGTF